MKKYLVIACSLLLISILVSIKHHEYPDNSAARTVWEEAHVFFGWPNGITVWALLLTMAVIAEQTRETRNAARATEDGAKATLLSAQALVNAERARIGFDIGEMGRSFRIDGKNSGKTAARIMYAHGFSVILAAEEKLPVVPCYANAPDDSAEWIGPNETFDLLTAPDRYGLIADLSDMDVCESIRDKKSVLWVFGCIRYFDGVSPDKRERNDFVSPLLWREFPSKPTFIRLARIHIEVKPEYAAVTAR